MTTTPESGRGQSIEPDSASSTSPSLETKSSIDSPLSIWRKTLNFITYTPKRCRYDPSNPPSFSLPLNLLFAFAGTFTVANLYYNHPILDILAHEFNVTGERASLIPTLAQTGYATGLLFLCPLGDVLPRRAYVLSLILFTATVWLGLCLTHNFNVFCFLTFLTSLTTVTPQLMLPLVGDLAPPHRRATSLSIVVAGLSLGLLCARVLSGTVANYSSWRNIYWMAFGLQYLIFVLLWTFMPDYPSTNPEGINYFRILWTILTIFVQHPLLVQACLIGFCTSATFTSFWTTLTFLLSSPPYEYSSLVIGLFALIGIASMFFGPLYSRLVTDRFVHTVPVAIGLCFSLLGICIGTYTGTFTVAGPVIQAFFLDLGNLTSQIANRSAIYGILPKARNRVNTSYMIMTFCGQLAGTAAGNHIYATAGWIGSGSTSVGFIGLALVLCFARGPWEKGWVGWRGGWGIRRRDLGGKDGSGREDEEETAGSSWNKDEKQEHHEGNAPGKEEKNEKEVAADRI